MNDCLRKGISPRSRFLCCTQSVLLQLFVPSSFRPSPSLRIPNHRDQNPYPMSSAYIPLLRRNIGCDCRVPSNNNRHNPLPPCARRLDLDSAAKPRTHAVAEMVLSQTVVVEACIGWSRPILIRGSAYLLCLEAGCTSIEE